MKIERAQHARMSETGSSLLRLIQNHELPVLDLLVRESIQNSLDAARDNTAGSAVDVCFITGNFETAALAKHLEGITTNLHKYFGGTQQQFIAVRDVGTVGLTGPMHFNEVRNNDFGNLLKLVYEVSKPQQKSGAGGSWGLGKTVFFRVGIGLVLYYSRIRSGSSYHSRLAACLVEDEKSKNALLGRSGHLDRGIAWWGQPYDSESTVPITDENEIREILDIFSLSPYVGDQTGTTIVIPFISETKLISDALSSDDSFDEHMDHPWFRSLDEYLRLSIQRWYAPRLLNPLYSQGCYLRAFVNEEPIRRDTMMPVFQAIQALYNRTDAVRTDETNDILLEEDVSYCVQQVSLNKVFKENRSAGQVAFAVMSRKQLRMNYPNNNASPLVHIGKLHDDSSSNPPIIAYTRRPAMVVAYETEGPWVRRIPHTSSDEFLIGIFVPNKDNVLRDEFRGMSLEEYLRSSEQADHASWTDFAIDAKRPGIVEKIRSQVARKVAEAYRDQPDKREVRHLGGLSRALADILLPPEGFGSGPTVDRELKKKDPQMRRRTRRTTLDLDSPVYDGETVAVPFVVTFGQDTTHAELVVTAQTERGTLHADQWESPDEIGTTFPIRLVEVEVSKIGTGKRQRPFVANALVLSEARQQSLDYQGVNISLLASRRNHVPYGIRMSVPETTGYSIQGVIRVQSSDTMIQAALEVVRRGEQSS